MKGTRFGKKIIWFLVSLFIFMNVVAFFHAYKFTHFTDRNVSKTNAKELSALKKLQVIVFGIDNPRPVNKGFPSQPFQTIKLQSNKIIECWYIKAAQARGTIVLFHGYAGQKSSLLLLLYILW